MIRRLAMLFGGSLAFGVLTAIPAARLWGPAMVANAAVAAGLCVLPTAVALLLADWVLRDSPQQQLLVVLGGTGLRMAVVLGLGSLLYGLVPYFAEQELLAFWGWILIYYLFTLTLEVVLLLGRPTPGRVSPP